MAATFSSCWCSCDCSFCEGCTTIEAVNSANDSTVAKKTFCSSGNLLNDFVVFDSIKAFKSRYPASSITFKTKDTTWNCDKKLNLTCKESDKLKKYTCKCVK